MQNFGRTGGYSHVHSAQMVSRSSASDSPPPTGPLHRWKARGTTWRRRGKRYPGEARSPKEAQPPASEYHCSAHCGPGPPPAQGGETLVTNSNVAQLALHNISDTRSAEMQRLGIRNGRLIDIPVYAPYQRRADSGLLRRTRFCRDTRGRRGREGKKEGGREGG